MTDLLTPDSHTRPGFTSTRSSSYFRLRSVVHGTNSVPCLRDIPHSDLSEVFAYPAVVAIDLSMRAVMANTEVATTE